MEYLQSFGRDNNMRRKPFFPTALRNYDRLKFTLEKAFGELTPGKGFEDFL